MFELWIHSYNINILSVSDGPPAKINSLFKWINCSLSPQIKAGFWTHVCGLFISVGGTALINHTGAVWKKMTFIVYLLLLFIPIYVERLGYLCNPSTLWLKAVVLNRFWRLQLVWLIVLSSGEDLLLFAQRLVLSLDRKVQCCPPSVLSQVTMLNLRAEAQNVFI